MSIKLCSLSVLVVLATLISNLPLVIPSVKADDLPAITRRDLTTSTNNLKQIALATLNYHDSYGHYPTNIADKSGKELLSWRVAILPFIEQNDLYKQFKLDEPWDSVNNKKLIEKMPKLYAPVRAKAKPGETFYQVFYGEKALFGPKHQPKIIEIFDGTSNTGLVFEAAEPVIWSKPADLPFDEKKPLPKLGGLFDGDFHVAMCDGAVYLLKKDADEKMMKNLIMPADGNVMDISKLKKK